LIALLAGGAMAVHQLRYLLAYGDGSHHALESQGHAYLGAVAAAVVGLFVLAAVDYAVRLWRAEAGSPPKGRQLWAACSLWLIAIYGSQELAEGQLAAGHPHGLNALFGHGGWIALLLALVIGGVISLLLVASERAVRFVAARRRADRVSAETSPRPRRRFAAVSRHRLRPLGARAPPLRV
jgi:hypothetical protein